MGQRPDGRPLPVPSPFALTGVSLINLAQLGLVLAFVSQRTRFNKVQGSLDRYDRSGFLEKELWV